MTTTKKATTARKTVAQRKSADRNDKQNDVVARITNAVDEQLAAEKTIADAKSAAAGSVFSDRAERASAAIDENKALKAWEKGGKKGPRPFTGNIDAIDHKEPTKSSAAKKSSEPRQLVAPLVDRNVETIKCVSCNETKPSNVFPTRGKDKRATECRDCGIVRRGGTPKAAKPKAAAKKKSTTSKNTPAKSAAAKKSTRPATKKSSKAA